MPPRMPWFTDAREMSAPSSRRTNTDSFPTTTNAYAPSCTEYPTEDGHGHGICCARRDAHHPFLPPLRQHPYDNINNTDSMDLK
ncbi:hypothetical protein C8J57DRAFT_1733960 [Mycena rebaudengoi]|nr:hypothetical protein C8J57DRAFT_1733960 [Mycena rebaudengoi]